MSQTLRPTQAASLGASAARPARAVGVLIAAGVVCAALAMGLRNSFGLFLAPRTAAHAWTASGFAFAIALQVLLNGLSQPFMGQAADRFGGRSVIIGGALLQAAAIAGMALSSGLTLFTAFAGLLMGVAVSAAGMPVIIASLTRLLPDLQRGRASGLGTAGSSFGQFLVVPVVQLAITGFGWQAALLLVAAASLLMIPLALPLNDRPAAVPAGPAGSAAAPGQAAPEQAAAEQAASGQAAPEQTARAALAAALRDPSFWCLFCGFFVCGLHATFMGVHMPPFVASCHLPIAVGAGALSLIGLFNIAGSLAS